MARCYSAGMPPRHSYLPDIWLVTDARNDAVLEAALARLPRGSGLIFRHYHLPPDARRKRFAALARLARKRGHHVILSGTDEESRRWRADGAYRAPAKAGVSGRRQILCNGMRSPPSRGLGLLLITAHSLREIGTANRARADAIVLAPVFPTRSHPGAITLGPVRFRLLAARSRMPVIALGGMNKARASRLGARKWAAIDGI